MIQADMFCSASRSFSSEDHKQLKEVLVYGVCVLVNDFVFVLVFVLCYVQDPLRNVFICEYTKCARLCP